MPATAENLSPQAKGGSPPTSAGSSSAGSVSTLSM
jgi:hypothetical protein